MSGTSSSNPPAEGSNPELNLKRQSEVDDESSDLAVKKPKTKPSFQEEAEKEKSLEIEADVAEDKGTRHSMEDAWVIMLDATLNSPGKLRCGHFAIYDGHGGRLAAEYAQKHLHANVVSAGLPRELRKNLVLKVHLEFFGYNNDLRSEVGSLLDSIVLRVQSNNTTFEILNSNVLPDIITIESLKACLRVIEDCGIHLVAALDVKTAKRAILEGFRKTDQDLLKESSSEGWQDGATAVCVWVIEKTVFVANIGDAKAVVARSADGSDNSPLKAIVLTRDHKAIYPQERARIQKAGGTVSSNGRLQGRLEVSRAFGDRQFKKVGVVATPEIHSFDLTDREHFIILGCDGLWGVFGPSDAVEFVQKLLKEGFPVTAVSRRLVREAVRERRCKDNCTAIVIVFRRK
ncbi:hypothetical protein V6N13_145805 [Hibiscus sabdariffa]